MIIFAHRANLDQASRLEENSRSSVGKALTLGFTIETDIRRNPAGHYYISHDPALLNEENNAVGHAALWQECTAGPIALNIKEEGHEDQLIAFLRRNSVLNAVFLFDMELVEQAPGGMARKFRELDATVLLAARVSDQDEPLRRALMNDCARIIWLDEFNRFWATREDIARLKETGRTVFAVSPELHGFGADPMRRRWDEFATWGVDGICTDWPMACAEQLGVPFNKGASK